MYKIKEVKQNPCDVGFEMELLGRIPELFFSLLCIFSGSV